MNFSARFPRHSARILIAVVAIAALALSGCNKNAKALSSKEGGRVYLDGLFYQVQLSRQLNPQDVEDSYYLTGQPAPPVGSSYFGVFMRVDNEDSQPRLLPIGISHMKIIDAVGHTFLPIPVKAKGWGYAPAPLGKGGRLPIPDTPADIGPIRGGLILFKIPYSDLDSRPLELKITDKSHTTASVTLDV